MLTSCIYYDTAAAEEVVKRLVCVDSVKIVLLPSFPARVQIIVKGQIVKDIYVDVKQERKDREVTVMMTQIYSQRILPHLELFEKTMFLEGGFPPGKYSLKVNDYSMTFEVN